MAKRRASSPPRRRRRRTRRRGAAPPKLLVGLLAALAGLLLIVGIERLSRDRQTHHRPRLSMAEARAANAAIPFVAGPVRPAARFTFHGTPAAREQAIDCLATAALYEAGDDVGGQRAVMQVVLNRVRRPGYPKTVCGVVYQGAVPGGVCQFSFACDGSLKRRPETAGWPDARARARHALSGAVFATVGTATHYHTDWVVPWWSDSLDKIAKVSTHIFYRPKSAAADPPER
jgi:spore germination cell wall hydrolase CwlJ-like protein